MWYVVLIGAVINIAMVWLFDMKLITHLFLGGLLSFFLGTMIFLIAAMDNPFRGEVSISPAAFEAVYKIMMEESYLNVETARKTVFVASSDRHKVERRTCVNFHLRNEFGSAASDALNGQTLDITMRSRLLRLLNGLNRSSQVASANATYLPAGDSRR
jgi:hypothetical protein